MADNNETIQANSSVIPGMARSYNSNSSPQLSAVQASIPFIRQAIDVLDIDSSSFPVIIADFGSSHGANSLCAIKTIIDYVKESKKTESSLLVIHNDIPTNDWTALFDILNQDKSYFGLSSGRSFYEQCLPSNFLTIAYSSSSIQWLSRKPCSISNHFVHLFAEGEEFAAFKTQAQHDYERFLENRSRELRHGGVLIVTIISADEKGKTPVDYPLCQLYNCAQLLPLTDQELLDYTIPIYIRTYKECLDEELFKRCSLQLVNSGFCKSRAKFDEDFQRGEITVEQLAQLHTDFMRAWSESTLRQALEISGKRSKEDINHLVNQFWAIYKEGVDEKPDEYISDMYQTYLVLKKV